MAHALSNDERFADEPSRAQPQDMRSLPSRFLIAGMRANVGASFTDLWPLAADMTYPTTAATASLVSTSTQDAAAGTGARRMRLVGFGANWTLQEEEVALAGTGAISTTKRFIRLISARVTGTGSANANVGDVTVTIGGITVAFVAAGDNRSLQTQFSVPPDYDGTFENFRISSAFGTTAFDGGAVRLMARFDGGGPFFALEELGLAPALAGVRGPCLSLAGPADFTVRVFGSGSGSAKRVSVGYDVVLRPRVRSTAIVAV